MPSNLFDLPIHILVIHAVVVLLPLAALAAIAVAASRTVRARFGAAIVAGTFVVTLFVPIATQTGENLRSRLPNDPLIARHASLGQALLTWTAAFGVMLAMVVALDIYRRASTPGTLNGVEGWLADKAGWRTSAAKGRARLGAVFLAARLALVVTTAVMVLYVVLAGDSGARAVWSHYPNLTTHATTRGGG